MQKQVRHFFVLFALSLGTACTAEMSMTQPVFVNSRDEAAAVLIVVNTVAPWDQVADALQPNFALTGDQALQQIVPTTERIQEQVLTAFGLSLGLGLPQSFSQSSTTKTISPPQTAGSTSTTTSTTQPGSVPQAPTGVPAGGQLPAAPAVSGDIGLDPILRYQAALALYQAVQLMNREVQNAAVKDGFVPYLVTVKFAVMPYRRNLPYDMHARISFFPPATGSPGTPLKLTSAETDAKKLDPATDAVPTQRGCHDSQKLPQIVPLLVTDDIERALKSRAVEAARQLGVALSFMSHGVGGSLGASNVNQTLDAISGQEINSRLTVTRLSDNTIYARIGAAYETTAGVALVGQTYNVSLLLLVPFDYFVREDCEVQIQILTHSEFRDAFHGGILADRPTSTLVRQADQAMQATLVGGTEYRNLLMAWNSSDDKTKESITRRLAGPIQTSNFTAFNCALKRTKKLLPVKEEEGQALSLDELKPDYKRALWTRLSVVLADSSFKSAHFELRRPPTISVPKQTALLLDDTKDKAQAQLQTVSGAPSRTITASVMLNAKVKGKGPKNYELVAQTVSLDPISRVLTLTFPSPAKWGIEEVDSDNSSLKITQECPPKFLCPKLTVPSSLPLLYVAAKAADAAPNLSFSAKVTQIVATKAGDGSVTVTVDKLKDDYALITVEGVDVKAAVDSSGATLTISNGQVKVTQTTTITFQLHNLHAGMTFVIEAEGHQASSTTGKKQLQFTVLGG